MGALEGALETFQTEQQHKNTKYEEHFAELKAHNERLEKQLHMANKSAVSSEEVQSDNFDRPPNLEVIRINANRFVTKNSVEDQVTPWLTTAGTAPEQWTLEGGTPTGKKIVIRFLLNPLSAARMVQDSLKSLKNKDGVRKTFDAKLVNGQTEPLHIGPDEAPKSRTQRRMARVV